jgi:DNA polymerase III sliding clamp (beta) subunit (PCNA family)
MYTKQNFQIAKIANAACKSRLVLNAVQVTPSETRACDGTRLVRVKSTGETGEFAPFLMSASQALDAAKAGKEPAAFTPDTHVNGHVTVQVGRVTLTDKKPEGKYPDVERIIPAVDETWQRITFDAKLMKELMEIHAASGKYVSLYVKPGTGNAIVIETTRGEGPDVQSLLMPCHDGKDNDGKPVIPARY